MEFTDPLLQEKLTFPSQFAKLPNHFRPGTNKEAPRADILDNA
jgi:hypothetical protein